MSISPFWNVTTRCHFRFVDSRAALLLDIGFVGRHRHVGDASAGRQVVDGDIGAQPADDLRGVESKRHCFVSFSSGLLTMVAERVRGLSQPLPCSPSPSPPRTLVCRLTRCPRGDTGLADRTAARAGCREGRQPPDAADTAPGPGERVQAIAPSRREALHMDTGWGAVSVADPGSPPAAAPSPRIDRPPGPAMVRANRETDTPWRR